MRDAYSTLLAHKNLTPFTRTSEDQKTKHSKLDYIMLTYSYVSDIIYPVMNSHPTPTLPATKIPMVYF